MPPPEATFTAPAEIEEYRLTRPLGAGGMGQVWLAHDTLLDRPVAVKLVAGLHPSPAARQRFFLEARAMARLQHPNVATVHRVGAWNGVPYLVSEWVRGASLRDVPRPVPPERLRGIALGLARGLAAAHQRGVLHRDLKPGNVVLGEAGEVKLIDFGLAKLLETSPPAAPAGAPTPTPPAAPPGAIEDASTITPSGETEWAALPASAPTPSTVGPATLEGRVFGTPRYMAPEQWTGAPTTARTDVWGLGAVLHELATGAPPFSEHVDALPGAVTGSDPAPTGTGAPELDPAFAAIVDRCLRRDPALRFEDAGAVLDALEALGRPLEAGVTGENPYRGLRVFETAHRALFFGRRRETREILERLRLEPFVLVAGDSGAGKSSLCRAGVLPAIDDGRLDRCAWASVVVRPGRRPLAALAAALGPALGVAEGDLAQRLRAAPADLGATVRAHLPEGRALLLLVDQLEEAVTLAPPDDAAVFCEAVASLAEGAPRTRLLATVRGDFLTRVAELPAIGERVAESLFLLGALDRARLREVVVGPAELSGARFESEALVDALVEGAARTAGGLPLLEFALAELWEARDARTGVIPAAALEAAGGVDGALARHADDVVRRMRPAVRAAARRVLVQLVGVDGTRVRRSADELAPREDPTATRAALDALVEGRLVVALEGDSGGAWEIAHEALVEGWAALRSWLAEEVESRERHERLLAAAAEWRRLGQAPDALLRGRQLAETAGMEASALGAAGRAFLEASRTADRRRRALGIGTALGVLLALVTVWGGVEWRVRADRERRVDAALAAARRTLGRVARAEQALARDRRESFARFDGGDEEAGEARWSAALEAAEQVDRGYARASQSIERALTLDGARRDARDLAAAALAGRARHAERMREPALQDELLARLALYDPAGRLLARWRAPARLRLEVDPPSATVSMFREERQPDGRRQRRPLGKAGPAPAGPIPLAAGTILVEASAPGRATVRLPLALERGEERAVSLALPEARRVPEGFVWIPPGRFLFGSGGEESLRRFRYAAPLHARTTPGYLIGRTEVTFAAYIEYLEALPADERTRRAPGAQGVDGAVSLQKSADGWAVSLQSFAVALSARGNEPIRYPARRTEREHDWRSLPVTGVSCLDFRAYAAWLDREGRVPGARLCSEVEWERAARGADDREYPHGDALGPEDANIDAAHGGDPAGMGPDAVGSHPASRSPFGLDDMAGNVWECVTAAIGDEPFVVRGGAFGYDATTAPASNREIAAPERRDVSMGARLCANILP